MAGAGASVAGEAGAILAAAAAAAARWKRQQPAAGLQRRFWQVRVGFSRLDIYAALDARSWALRRPSLVGVTRFPWRLIPW